MSKWQRLSVLRDRRPEEGYKTKAFKEKECSTFALTVIALKKKKKIHDELSFFLTSFNALTVIAAVQCCVLGTTFSTCLLFVK